MSESSEVRAPARIGLWWALGTFAGFIRGSRPARSGTFRWVLMGSTFWRPMTDLHGPVE
jgi:hypothetical protein